MAIQCTAADYHLRSSQAMALSSRSAFTVTTWLNCTWNGGARRSFVGIYGGSTDTPLATPITAAQIGTSAGTGDLAVWTWGGGTLVSVPALMTARNGAWVFIAYTYDGTTHSLYLNGALQATAATTQIAGQLNQVYINGYPGGATSETDAFQIDQYALYRRALPADEILTMYDALGARHGDAYSLICRYEFDEGVTGAAVSSVVDLSGNGNTLTSTGAGTSFTYTYNSTVANSNTRMVQ